MPRILLFVIAFLSFSLHANSPLKNKPFIKVNVGALPMELLEAELFGAEAGAFTGATINALFTDFYQDMARGHFTVKRLEHKYGFEPIKDEYALILGKRLAG